MSERLVLSNLYDDSEDKIKLDITKLPTLKVESIKVDSQFKNCVRVSTDNLFRGNIVEFPLIDVIVNDRTVEIKGLIVGKLYSGLILNLEYINENKYYLLEDFSVEFGDRISQYICTTYKIVLKRDVEEEEFNEWYYKLQQDINNINDFIKEIITGDEFLALNKDLDYFIKILYGIVFRRHISDEQFNHWKKIYSEKILNETEEKVRSYIIDEMIEYKRYEYLLENK